MATTLTNTGITFPDATSQTTAALPEFASGTVMLFQQTAAPTGWTKSTGTDNAAIRLVSGTVGSGGTEDFTAAFASQAAGGTVASTTLTTPQIPSHTHRATRFKGGPYSPTTGPYERGNFPDIGGPPTTATGGGGSHTHSFTGSSINLAVKYVDVIVATKN